MMSLPVLLFSSLAWGQVVVFAQGPQAAPVAVSAAQPNAHKASDSSNPRGTVFTVDNERFFGPIITLKDGQLSIDSDPEKILPLEMVERIEMGTVSAPSLIWIGQDNRDLTQPGSAPGTNGIQDIHLRCTGIASARSLTQVVITTVVGGAPQVWMLEPSNTPFWRMANERTAGTDKADFYLEPSPADCFEQPFEVMLTFDDKRTVKSRVIADTHTDSSLKVATTEKNESKGPAGPGAALVLLAEAQSMHGHLSAIDKEALSLKVAGQQLDIPMSDVLGCWLGGETPEQRKLFDERLQNGGTTDWVLIMSRDNVATAVEGNVQRVSDDKLELVVADENRKVSLDRVIGFVLATHPLQPPSDAFRQVFELANGDKLTGLLVGVTPDTLEIRTSWNSGLKLTRSEVRAIAFRNGRATYLSDLKPTSVEEASYFTRRLSYRIDQNLLGDPLVLRGTTYRKGLAVHARSVLTYALDKRFETFQAQLGFDDAAPPGGSVACRVLVDDRELYANPNLRQDNEPVPLKLNITGANQLVLEVDFGQEADVGDRIFWAGARVFRATPQAENNVPETETATAERTAPMGDNQPPRENP